MTDPEKVLTQSHGVASWRSLRSAGMTRTELRHALTDGWLEKARRGWYATSTAHPTVKAAVKTGGVCSCLSALALHGVWLPEGDDRTHTRARSNVHNDPGAHPRHCRRYGRPLVEDGAVDDVATAFAHALRCLNSEGIVVVMDSIMNLELMSRDELEAILKPAPKKVRKLLDRTADSGSGTETMTRFRLARYGLEMKTQVKIPEVGRVDMLVGTRLIIEVDGEEYHASSEQFHKDRERDLAAHRLGYITIRLTYRQVVHQWESTREAILSVIRRGDHLVPLPAPETASEPAECFP
ncbi:MAG: type IV toxin-antitoxin system AbiEi family antitoxin domain-containing protein [Gordonia sp. (in: high G+C Gram-positive bacteria)]